MSRDGKASDGASPPNMQEGEVHDGTSPWESQGALFYCKYLHYIKISKD